MQWLRSKSLFTNTHKRCFCEQHVRIVFVFLAKENTKRFTGCDMDLVNQRILSPNGHFLFFTKIRIFFLKIITKQTLQLEVEEGRAPITEPLSLNFKIFFDALLFSF